jgi:histone deacetylase 1/2
VCQLCGKVGHVASRCFKRFKKEFLGVGNDGRQQQDGHHQHGRQAAAITHGGAHANQAGVHGGHTPPYALDPGWYADSGATDHLTSELDKLSLKERYGGKDKVHTADGSGMHIYYSTIQNSSRPLHLRDVLHVPSVTRNLLSIPRFTRDNNVFFEFHPWYFFVKDRDTRKILLRGGVRGGLYRVDESSVKQVFSGLKVSREKWHARLGHPATPIVQHILHRNKLPLVASQNNVICDACQQGKSHQLPFSDSNRVISKPLEFIYSDVWGPAQTSTSGHSYYVSFIDGYSRFTWLYLLKHKSDVFHIFIAFQKTC